VGLLPLELYPEGLFAAETLEVCKIWGDKPKFLMKIDL
jgi:hypothetical protein